MRAVFILSLTLLASMSFAQSSVQEVSPAKIERAFELLRDFEENRADGLKGGFNFSDIHLVGPGHPACSVVSQAHPKEVSKGHPCFSGYVDFLHVQGDVESLYALFVALGGGGFFMPEIFSALGMFAAAFTVNAAINHNCRIGKVKLEDYTQCLTDHGVTP